MARSTPIRLLLVPLLFLSGACWASDALPRRAALGAQIMPSAEGVLVQAALPGGTAEALGLEAGDRLLRIDQQTIRGLPDVFAWAASSRGDAPIVVEIERNNARQRLAGTAKARAMEGDGEGYRVIYGQVTGADGARLRTLLSLPDGDGPFPLLMLIQGITLSSIDSPLTDNNPYARLLGPFARAGYATLRVDKPGTGDSEGGPASALDFDRELVGYRAALRSTRDIAAIDRERIFLVGHSMGGIWAPMLADEFDVAGIAAYGTVFRTWNEYDLENARRQFRLAGDPPSDIHETLQRRAALNTALLVDGLTISEARQRPGLDAILAEEFVDGVWNGRALAFWQQLAAVNIARLWSTAKTPVLAMHGDADFVAARTDHELLAETVRSAGGDAQFIAVPQSDHGFQAAASERAAYAALGQPGTYSSTAARHLDRWLAKRTGLRAFDALDDTLDRLPAGSGSGRTMDASLGDVDADGDLDLVLAKEFAGNVLLRREADRFVAQPDAFPASAEDSEDVVLGDFDGDGDLDAIFPSEDTALNEYVWNDGAGRFSAAPHALPGKTTSNAGVSGDIDDDGDLDLILSRNDAPELVLLNDGRGRFTDASSTWMPANVDVTQDLALADLDADGDLDLVVGNEPRGGGRNRVYRNQGERFVDISDDALPAPAVAEETRKIALGDADGDGDLDMYLANVDFSAPDRAVPRLLINDGNARFGAGSHLLADAVGSVLDASFVDLDGDRDSDLLLGTIGRGSRLLMNDGKAFVDRTPAGYASGEPGALGIVAVTIPGVGVFESAFDRGDRLLRLPAPAATAGLDGRSGE